MIEVECLDCGEWSDDPETGCAWCDSTNIKIHGKRGGKRKGAGRKPEVAIYEQIVKMERDFMSNFEK